MPFDDPDAVRRLGPEHENVVAVLIEPVQGEGGINVSRLSYLRALAEICAERQWLFMSDEVQCGLGRTGRWFVYQHAGFIPDVVTLAKGLGSGVPVGACVAGGRARGLFGPGNHGSTFGGNPLAMTAVVTTIETIRSERLLENAERLGAVIRDGLRAGLAGVPGVREVRGMGLMVGVELERPCKALVSAALEHGLVINVTHENVVRLLPPLIVREAEAREIVARLVPLIRQFVSSTASA